MEGTKICPYCGEEIKAVAKKCRFCGQWLDEDTNEVATKGEEVKPQDAAPVEQVAPNEEVEEDNKATDTVVASKPDSETSTKGRLLGGWNSCGCCTCRHRILVGQ